jgi:hypothetical protein
VQVIDEELPATQPAIAAVSTGCHRSVKSLRREGVNRAVADRGVICCPHERSVAVAGARRLEPAAECQPHILMTSPSSRAAAAKQTFAIACARRVPTSDRRRSSLADLGQMDPRDDLVRGELHRLQPVEARIRTRRTPRTERSSAPRQTKQRAGGVSAAGEALAMFPPNVPRFCVATPPFAPPLRRGWNSSTSVVQQIGVGRERANRPTSCRWFTPRSSASPHRLTNRSRFSAPASSSTIRSVPANGFQIPGSSAKHRERSVQRSWLHQIVSWEKTT